MHERSMDCTVGEIYGMECTAVKDCRLESGVNSVADIIVIMERFTKLQGLGLEVLSREVSAPLK